MPKPDRPPDVLMSIEGWDDLTEEQRNERMEQFLEALRAQADKARASDDDIEPPTNPKEKA